MSDLSTLFNSITRPSVSIRETNAGYRVLNITSFSSTYMVGTSASGSFINPTLVTSATDFTNQFGVSPSLNSVKLFFANHRDGLLYFIRTPIASEFLVKVLSATGTSSVLISATPEGQSAETDTISYIAQTGDTLEIISSALITQINASPIASYVTATVSKDSNNVTIADELKIKIDDPSSTLTVTTTTAPKIQITSLSDSAKATDFIYAITNFSDPDDSLDQGFLIAPEAFQTLSAPSDRLVVGQAMETLASDKEYDWVALVDCGTNQSLSTVQTEAVSYTSPQGHTSYYAPYLITADNSVVPASAAVAAIATKRFKLEGFQQPQAGMKYPLSGVKDTNFRYSNADQSVLNPLGVNLIRNLRNKGVVIWGMRTRSSDPFYRFTNTRVIMNVLNGTLRYGFDNQLFSAVDGFGILLLDIKHTAASVCRRLWKGGAFFGNSEEEAFEVVCDFTNNAADQLELGNVVIQVFVAPAPSIEKILVQTIRTSIGQVQSSAASAQQN